MGMDGPHGVVWYYDCERIKFRPVLTVAGIVILQGNMQLTLMLPRDAKFSVSQDS
uniref:Uncharacterized protein n=1 Tax=Anguilla anguilla TaxID=7936 RepID=A0A0E9V4J0_ANGAN